MGNYIDQTIAEYWLSSAGVRRLYDDNNDGVADASPLLRAIDDTESEFEATALCVYPSLEQLRAVASACLWILRILFLRTCAERFPRAFGQAGGYWLERGTEKLNQLREGKIKLAVQGAPNPPINVGGDMYLEGIGLAETQRDTFTRNGFGDY